MISKAASTFIPQFLILILTICTPILTRLSIQTAAPTLFATESRWQDVEDRKVEVGLIGVKDGAGKLQALKVFIRDNGTGMDEVTRQRIFDPFYTTKDVGKGTGLGLSIVKGILDDHGAEVRVESAVGEGTEFQLLFAIDAMKGGGTQDRNEAA